MALDDTEGGSARSDRLVGCLLGTALGDAIGLPFEGLSRRRVQRMLGDSELEHRLGRGPTDEEVAAHLHISNEELDRWLAAIASTTVGPLDRAIAAGAEPAALDGPGSESPTAIVEDHELGQIMRSEIRKLPEREKLVISLYYDEGLTLAEIGQVLGVTESRVSQIHTKSVLHLRSRLSAAGVG